jgi:glycerol-3-phosphate dehydrogenase
MRRNLEELARRRYDLVVVGGGITGAAIARDAALRGLSVALLEARDFSHATSAATSKLVHGGLRYLKTLDLGLVRESLAERRIWQRIAPHMVYPLPFLLPVPEGFAAALAFHTGLTLYDLGGARGGGRAYERAWIPAHRWIDRAEALTRAPILSGTKLRRAMLYYDCQMFAPERLALECLADAADHGANLANYAEVADLRRAPVTQTIEGVIVKDARSGQRHDVSAALIVNATGPWADIALKAWGVDEGPARLTRSKGIHIITRALAHDHALTLPTESGHLFVLPWRGHSLIGTTDTPYAGSLDSVRPARTEIEGLIATLNRALPGADVTLADVRYAYAGVRPLVAPASAMSTYKMSRRAEIIEHGASGRLEPLISAIGGKWTTARHLAEQTVDLALRRLGRPHRPSRTAELPLPGGRASRFLSLVSRLEAQCPMLSSESVAFLARSYGSLAPEVLALGRPDARLLEPLARGLPQIGAQVAYAIDHEMALSLEDVVLRRIGLGTLGFPGEAALARCAGLMAARLGWSEESCAGEIARLRAHYHETSRECGL